MTKYTRKEMERVVQRGRTLRIDRETVVMLSDMVEQLLTQDVNNDMLEVLELIYPDLMCSGYCDEELIREIKLGNKAAEETLKAKQAIKKARGEDVS